MFSIFRDKDDDEKEQARLLFEKVAALKSESRETRVARIRMGLLCRAHLDKTFIAGAEQTAAHLELAALALVHGKDKPETPQASPYQTVKSGDKNLTVYLPEEYAELAYLLGAEYQQTKIDAYQAIERMQALADQICRFELNLEQPFEVLQFLREDLVAGGSAGPPEAAEQDHDPDNAQGGHLGHA